jgi:hypothetical protein
VATLAGRSPAEASQRRTFSADPWLIHHKHLTVGFASHCPFRDRQPEIAVHVQLPPALQPFASVLQGASLVQEEGLRALLLAALFSVAVNAAAFADESVSGDWHANLGGGVSINMTVAPDGGWSSETLQRNEVVRQMRGTYKQTPSDNGTGTLVFVPTQATVQSGKVQTETDKYELAGDGKQLKLTSDGDTMVFEKRQPK